MVFSFLHVVSVLIFWGVQGICGRDIVLVLYSSKLDSIAEFKIELESLTANGAPSNSFELILRDLNTSSCRGDEAKAVSVFIEEVFVNRNKGDNVLATIGPSCTDSAYAISRLANRSEISMTHLLTSPMPAALVSQLPDSFGLLGPVELLADASIELIQHANWSQVIALYQDTDTEMNVIFHYLREQLNNSEKLGYSSIVYDGHIPLKFALSHFAVRIFFLLMDRDLARKVLCEAFYLEAIYPNCQWVIFRTALNDLLKEDIVFLENGKLCHIKDMMVVLRQAIILGYDEEIKGTVYENSLKLLSKGLKLSQMQAFPLIGALSQLYGQEEKRVYISQIQENFTLQKRTFTGYDDLGFNLIPSNFTRISDTVRIEVFYFTLVLISIQFIATALMQILTIYYRKTKAIKATSPNIQQIASIGLHMVIFTTLIYTIQKSLQMDDELYAHLCNVYVVFANFSFTLVLGSLCVKTWRLYRIFNHYMDPGDLLSDKILTPMILSLTTVDAVISILWIVIGDAVRTEVSHRTDFQRRVEIAQDVCREKYYFVWFIGAALYHTVQLSVSIVLSVKVKSTAPKYQKQFRRNEVILLTYLVTIVIVVGYPIYFLAQFITGNILLEYIVAVSVSSCNVTLFLVLFFAFPLFRAARENRQEKHSTG